MTITEARFAIEARLVALAAGTGRVPMVDQVDAVQADDGGIVVYVHLVNGDELNGGMPLVASVDWGSAAFDENEFVQAFWRAGPPSVARN